MNDFHVSCLPKKISLKALEVLKTWQENSDHQPVFYIKSSGNMSDYDNIFADDIREDECDVAVALCFGFYFGSKT